MFDQKPLNVNKPIVSIKLLNESQKMLLTNESNKV